MAYSQDQPTTRRARRVGSFVHILITLCIPPWNNTTYVIPEQCPSRLTHHAYMRPWVLNSRSAELHTFTRVMAQCESTCGALAGMKEEEESRALFLRPFLLHRKWPPSCRSGSATLSTTIKQQLTFWTCTVHWTKEGNYLLRLLSPLSSSLADEFILLPRERERAGLPNQDVITRWITPAAFFSSLYLRN